MNYVTFNSAEISTSHSWKRLDLENCHCYQVICSDDVELPVSASWKLQMCKCE